MNILAPLFTTDANEGVTDAIDQLLADGEGVLGLQQTGPVRSVGEDGWLLTTTRRSMLMAGDDPDAWHIETLTPGGDWDFQPSMGRDVFRVGSRELFEGPLIGGKALRRVFELASMPATERVYRAAVIHRDAGELDAAMVLFELARDRLAELAARDPSVAPRLHEAVFQVARLHYELEQPDQVKSVLEELTSMTPEDDLIELSESAGLDADDWWELLAQSHRAAGDVTAAASVYGILSDEDEAANRHVLEHARALRETNQIDAALECYRDYLDARRPPGSFPFHAPEADAQRQSAPDAWLDVVLEALDLATEHAAIDTRFELALELVRLRPERATGYDHMLALEPEVDDGRRATIATVREIGALLLPAEIERFAPPERPTSLAELPVLEAPVDDDAHDEAVVHPEERVRSNAFGKLLGKYVVSEQASDARLHCELVREDTYPAAHELTHKLADLIGVETPEVFISHQRAGIRALGQSDDPFLLVAMSHLDEDSERYLPPDALCFALATQLEHIRAGHLILTEAEYHQSLKKKGLQGAIAAVEMLPLGSLLAKTPLSKLGEAISSFKTKTQREWLNGALDFAESKGGDAFGWATGKLRERVGDDGRRNREALMKEQVAAFVLGALFTADRMGYLACGSLRSAVHAMLRLSPSAYKHIPEVEREGLLALFHQPREQRFAHRELALRLSELFDFALSESMADAD